MRSGRAGQAESACNRPLRESKSEREAIENIRADVVVAVGVKGVAHPRRGIFNFLSIGFKKSPKYRIPLGRGGATLPKLYFFEKPNGGMKQATPAGENERFPGSLSRWFTLSGMPGRWKTLTRRICFLAQINVK